MNGKILVVDDEVAVRSGLQLLLRRQGYDVRTACDGPSTLVECTSFQPDLILLDIVMPGRDGFDVCREIKSRPEMRLIPVVLITGLSEKSDRIRGIEAGADDFLSKPIDMTELDARVRSLLRLKSFTDELEHAEAVLFSLALSIEARDPYTHGHCARLAEFSARLGESIGLPAEEITALRRAGIVHDVGKVAVTDAVLLKPGPLAAEERALIREHPGAGERICSPLKSFRPVLPIIRHHHERWDGSGYPDGLRGEAIPLTARVLQIADVYDALTTQRPYRDALTAGEAWQILQDEVNRGWWDGSLMRKFREMMADWDFSVAANQDEERLRANLLAKAPSASK
ncbi:MAG TPA: HD domain-containing phosphohydrolase [Candidatus Limnocylindrales bacterium]|nr:HD domain-containing phosphohydrolase [Candidatus Limnocylindrales bacterium]